MTFFTKCRLALLTLSLLAGLSPFYVYGQQIEEEADTTAVDSARTVPYRPYVPSTRPTFIPGDRYGDPFANPVPQSPLYLNNPRLQSIDVEIDTGLNYTLRERLGNVNLRPITTMSFEEYKAYQQNEMLRNYWQSRSRSLDGESPVSGRGLIPKIYISPVFDRIFGGSYVDLQLRGFVILNFGGSWQKVNNPAIPIRQQRNGGFEFDQTINASVTGKVGEKLEVTANFDNNNSFDFENGMKVAYTGFKEDVLQRLEIGNVSLPLNNTLVQGAQNLFGIKAQLQFGKLYVTTVASTHRGKVESIDIPGGGNGQGRPFEKAASEYDENRHFFLGQFFRDNYERWVANTAQISSGVNITRVEVYVVNRNNDTRTLRNVVGLMDLAEGRRIYNSNIVSNGSTLPNSNTSNNLFESLQGLDRDADNINQVLENLFATDPLKNGTDFEKITGARKLLPTEFTFHPALGYISLNTRQLQNDEAIAVAYEYTYNGQRYKVGELSEDYGVLEDNEVIFLKLIRPRKISIRDQANRIIPTWDLMMKNIYSLPVGQLSREGFELRVIYRDDRTGIDNPQLQEGVNARNRQLIEILGLDRLNPVNDPQRDGNFDFVEGITINTTTGSIIFPYLEPFNSPLRNAFSGEPNEQYLIQKYVYDTLYRTTKAEAELFSTKNKFFIVGRYIAGSSREILIPGYKLTEGSVNVYAGGLPLAEGLDYTVDYTFGKVTILNDAILNSGKDIRVQYEEEDAFAFQTRSLLGTRVDYKVSDEFNFGTTLLYYNERPLITRNLIGTEPARNLLYGLDFNLNKESRMLTKALDAIPGISTREKSTINWSAEFAQLLPGTSNIVDGDGTAYIDDFENSATPYSLMSPTSWKLASTPRTNDNRFDPSGGALLDKRAGYHRAKIAWYQVDNQFYRDGGRFKPANISETDLQNHYIRAVPPNEIFPQRNLTQGVFYEQIFDVAYFPTERGQYNYTPNLTTTGRLPDPRSSWGGITTAIRTEVDFDKANIEYIEFWLLDPFISGPNGRVLDGELNTNNTTGGKIVFHLGSVSEDIMRDGKHAFENGLPPDGNLDGGRAELNEWGYVTTQQFLTRAFDNSASTRANQDVGLDGVPDQKEVETFQDFLNSLSAPARSVVQNDPSADNFRFYFDSYYDNKDAKVLERYKDYNGMDGNTPIVSGSDAITQQGSVTPDNEDLNEDNTLNELEEYYAYDIDLRPGQLDVGREYIVDKIQVAARNSGDLVNWYLFRIPIRQFEEQFGNIQGFKSVRYLRMILTDFAQPVVLRMANFRMVSSRWRRYTGNLKESSFSEQGDPNLNNFTLSVVNIEENAQSDNSGKKSPYVLPPGFIRDRDNTSSVPRQLNEQSIQMCIDDLDDGDARAMYKNIEMDFFNYGRIKMFVHANSEADDDDLTVFMRLGTDFDQNYYEVELPLKITKPANTNDPNAIWPSENEFDFSLSELYALKADRDRDRFPLNELYPREGPRQVGKHRMRIFGRPDMSSVRVIMIGVRNPKNDGQAHDVCIWANELRLTDFDRTPGWAVNTTLSAKLADFGVVSGAFRHTTFGFGSVNSKISERTREETTSYDISGSFNVDQFLPGDIGIRIPMFASFERTTIDPNYDPANPDLRIDAALLALRTDEERIAYKDMIRDQTERRSINFLNVRKIKTNPESPSRIYDIENFAFSYSFSEQNRRNFFLQEETLRQYRGGAVYNFAPKETGIEPFRNSEGLKSPYLRLIKDFNFSLLPRLIRVEATLDRSFNKKIYRNSGFSSEPNYQKYFFFNRRYNLEWNISRGLGISYSAMANAIIDEPEGDINTEAKRDSVITNIKNLGRMKNFDQQITANYHVPLDKIPLTDWIGADYRFQVNYNWKAGPVNKPDHLVKPGEQDLADSLDFKNIIQNSRETNLTGNLDLVKLYNKIGLLREINTPPRPQSTRPQSTRPQAPVQPDTTQRRSPALKGLLRLLMAVRTINGEYSVSEGTILPGFEPTASFFGLSKGFEAPGWGFVLGSQDPSIRNKAVANDWLVKKPSLTNPFIQNQRRAFSGRANVVPLQDLNITLNFRKEITNQYQEIFRWNEGSDQFTSLSPSRTGSYQITAFSLKTAFHSDNDELESAVFKTFENNLEIIRNRFNQVTGREYDSIGQDVLIPAFISAYTGKDPNTISLSPFQKTPLPNWRIEYNGLSRLEGFKDVFQSFRIYHGYTSTYSILNFSNSLSYSGQDTVGINVPIEDYNNGYYGTTIDGKIVPVYVISQVVIREQFGPLFGIEFRTKGRFRFTADYGRSRELALNISNAQITEVNSKEFNFKIDYIRTKMKLPFKVEGRTIALNNDITFNLSAKVSDNKTIQRKIDDLATVTNGNINIQLSPYVNYVFNQKLTMRVYFERTINEPMISNSYRRANTRFGIQVTYGLNQ